MVMHVIPSKVYKCHQGGVQVIRFVNLNIQEYSN